MDLALSLETPILRETGEIQSELEMGLNQAMSGNSRKLDYVASDCPALHALGPKGKCIKGKVKGKCIWIHV